MGCLTDAAVDHRRGRGGHGRSVGEATIALGEFELVGFVVDSFPELVEIVDFLFFGTTTDIEKFKGLANVSVVALGQDLPRKKLFEELCTTGFELATVFHPRAIGCLNAAVWRRAR